MSNVRGVQESKIQALNAAVSHTPACEFPAEDGAARRFLAGRTGSQFFEIRFESIGGLGAHVAAQILAEMAVLRLGLNAAQFSSYGSEKKGSVIRSFVRLGLPEVAIRTSAPVEQPDVIVVFHSALLRNPVTLAGLRSDGLLIFNSPDGAPMDFLAKLPKQATAIRVDAMRIAVEEKSRPNAVLLGTISTALPFLNQGAVLASLNETFGHRHPQAVASNEKAFRRGATEFEIIKGSGQAEGDLPAVRATPVWGYETAPIGGVVPMPGSTARNDLSTSRTGEMPVLNTELCVHCGICDLVCPDYCLVWSAEGTGPIPDKTRLLGVDYQYCKGCLRCVESCPTGALTRQLETPGMADRLRVPLFPDLIPGGKPS